MPLRSSIIERLLPRSSRVPGTRTSVYVPPTRAHNGLSPAQGGPQRTVDFYENRSAGEPLSSWVLLGTASKRKRRCEARK